MPSPFEPGYWDTEIAELWSELVPPFVDALNDGIQGGVGALPEGVSILMDYDLVNQAALEYTKAYRLQWISKIVETTRKQTTQILTDWLQSGAPLDDLVAELSPIFGQARAEMIASTEVTRIFAEANMMAWESVGYVSGKKWVTTRDDRVCPICQPMDGSVAATGNSFYSPSGGGGFPSPPAHVRCRCWLQPIVDIRAVEEQRRRRLGLA